MTGWVPQSGTRVRHAASGRTGTVVRPRRRFGTDGAHVQWDGSGSRARITWHPAAVLVHVIEGPTPTGDGTSP